MRKILFVVLFLAFFSTTSLAGNGDLIVDGSIMTGTGITFPDGSTLTTMGVTDITSRTSDYALKIGETVSVSYTNIVTVPLHVATEQGMYEVTINGLSITTPPNNNNVWLQPNNTTYTNAIYNQTITGNNFSPSAGNYTLSSFHAGCASVVRTVMRITTLTAGKSADIHENFKFSNNTFYTSVGMCYWNDTTTAWTSLGTIVFPFQQSGKIFIRRIA